MREILFRGKSEFNGEWVYGYYYMAKYYRSEPELYDYITIPHPEAHNAPSEHIPVIHETVGQYTGLTDKNGKKIFEGDIVQAYFRNNHSKQIFQVVFDDGMFLFDNGCAKVPKYDICAMEVIGNIHDNPELLGGADNGT